MTKTTSAVLLAFAIGGAATFWLVHHRHNTRQNNYHHDLISKLLVVEKDLSTPRQELLGYTKFTAYLTETKKAIEGQMKFLAVKVSPLHATAITQDLFRGKSHFSFRTTANKNLWASSRAGQSHSFIADNYILGAFFRTENDFAISRAASMNTRTAGVSVRFRSVTIATGDGLIDNLIGSSVSPYWSALSLRTERGSTAIYRPLLARLLRR